MKEDLFSRLSVLSLESWPKKGVCVQHLGKDRGRGANEKTLYCKITHC